MSNSNPRTDQLRGEGRPNGALNRRSDKLSAELQAMGHIAAATYLSTVVNDPEKSDQIRVAAAGYLLPYTNAKPGPIPHNHAIEGYSLPELRTVRD